MVKTLETSGEHTTGKKTFTEKEKAAALRLLKTGYTLKEAAEEVGCSTASLQNWKRSGIKTSLKVEAETGVKPGARTKNATHVPAENWFSTEPESETEEETRKPHVSFEELLTAYWKHRKDEILHTNKIRETHEILAFAYKLMTK